MDKKSKLPSMEEATATARTAAKTWFDLGVEQAQTYERFMRAQFGHATQQTRELSEFASAVTEANLKAFEKARQQGLELANQVLA